MPLYDYHCDANGETIEVVHGMSLTFKTWGELCAFMQRPLGDTPADAPITRLMGAGSVNNKAHTPTKVMKAQGEASFNAKAGLHTAAPMRTSKW